MKRLVGRFTLVISLLGIAAGAGGVLLTPSAGITGDDRDHMTEDRDCITNCDPHTQFCCDEREPG